MLANKASPARRYNTHAKLVHSPLELAYCTGTAITDFIGLPVTTTVFTGTRRDFAGTTAIGIRACISY